MTIGHYQFLQIINHDLRTCIIDIDVDRCPRSTTDLLVGYHPNLTASLKVGKYFLTSIRYAYVKYWLNSPTEISIPSSQVYFEETQLLRVRKP